MPTLKELVEIDELEQVWEASTEGTVLLFKQSTTCPISAGAFNQFNTYLESDSETPAFFVKVRESRPVSNQITEDLGVDHESPQIFIVKDREALWTATHGQITADSIKEAVRNF